MKSKPFKKGERIRLMTGTLVGPGGFGVVVEDERRSGLLTIQLDRLPEGVTTECVHEEVGRPKHPPPLPSRSTVGQG